MSPLGVQCGRRGSTGSDGRSLGTDEEGEESHVPMVLSKVLPVSRLELFSVWFTPKGSTLRRLSLGFSRPRSLVSETKATLNRTPNSFMTTRTSFCFSRERRRVHSEACPSCQSAVSKLLRAEPGGNRAASTRQRRDVLTLGHMLPALLCWRSTWGADWGLLWPQN